MSCRDESCVCASVGIGQIRLSESSAVEAVVINRRRVIGKPDGPEYLRIALLTNDRLDLDQSDDSRSFNPHPDAIPSACAITFRSRFLYERASGVSVVSICRGPGHAASIAQQHRRYLQAA